MIGFILRRLAVAIPTLLLLIVVSFGLMFAAPGGPFTKERALPAAVLKNLNEKYGLDDPFVTQVGTYIWRVVRHFDFGPSFVYPDITVNQVIAKGFPVTLTYGSIGFVLTVLIGITLGVIAAIRHNSWLDTVAVGTSVGAQVLPNFVIAPILLLTFTLWLRWLPGGGWGGWPYWIMPIIALTLNHMASITRLTRSSMLEVLGSNHIRTARAKGLSESQVILRHALKPAMLPVLSYLGPLFVTMVTGSVVVDMYFGTGGIGSAFVSSALSRDYAVMMGITILVGALTIFFNLLVDVLYAWIDPKIRY